MEIASGKWLSEPELMEDPTFFSQYQTMNPIDCSFDDINFQSFYPNIDQKIICHNNIRGSYINNDEAFHHQVEDDLITSRPTKQVKANNSWNISQKASGTHVISFDNSKKENWVGNMGYVIPQNGYKQQVEKIRAGSLSRTPLHAQDHVIAERNRREKISQKFISLAALIPDLKKTDKNSVLGEVINYLKQLKEQVTTLEEQVAKKTVESVTFVRKTQINADHNETSSSDENFDNQSNKSFPHEIEARVSDKDVLIRIHCEKNRGCISNIIKEIENLHLTVLNSNVFPFGQSTLDITIVAQMEAEFSMTVKDLVKSLRQALLKIMG